MAKKKATIWVPLNKRVEKKMFIELSQAGMLHQHRNITKLDRISHLLGKSMQDVCLVLGARGTGVVPTLELRVSRGVGGVTGGCDGVPLGSVEGGNGLPGKLSL